ncbi:MAG TPA: tRNA (N6-threonylcarbamoyladenosine(37)-N6)-methyltransferase TrmO [Edaphobacter sp.]|nr:tRNA (N6-threonylcarbamoyladenosine(37)-N6)-methyltransferase TrmO [Edaphobacter sp.]
MTDPISYSLQPVGFVHSQFRHREDAPRQGSEGAPEAWLRIAPQFLPALKELVPGTEIVVLTWLHLANRKCLEVHPRNNAQTSLTGVFATRSPDRPNPIGLHRVTIIEIDSQGLHVQPLEAVDGTPILDIKPVWND